MVERESKGGRADLTHKDLAKALKQKQQCKTCDKVGNRLCVEGKVITKLIKNVRSKHAESSTCLGCGAELICGGGGVAKTSEVGCPGP